MNKLDILVMFFLLLSACKVQEMKLNADARLMSMANQKTILYVLNERVYNLQHQELASYENDELFSKQGLIIAYIKTANIYNLNGQLLGTVNGNELLNARGEVIAVVEGKDLKHKAKVAAYFFFL